MLWVVHSGVISKNIFFLMGGGGGGRQTKNPHHPHSYMQALMNVFQSGSRGKAPAGVKGRSPEAQGVWALVAEPGISYWVGAQNGMG